MPISSRTAVDLRRRWAEAFDVAATFELPDATTVVVVPHPDDETLSTGALVSAQRRAGRRVVVIAVTDGEAAYDAAGDPVLAAVRRDEQERALAQLGVHASDVIRLGLPDGRVADRTDAIVSAVRAVATAESLVVAPWTRDVHPDHEACGRAAAHAAAAVGADIVFGLFWTYHHRSPSDLDGVELLRLVVDADGRRSRELALACHRSQFDDGLGTPILEGDIADPATWDFELFVDGCRR